MKFIKRLHNKCLYLTQNLLFVRYKYQPRNITGEIIAVYFENYAKFINTLSEEKKHDFFRVFPLKQKFLR